MALPTSGQIDLNAIHVEAGGTTQTEVSLNDSDVRGLISKDGSTQNAFSEYYGASSSVIQSGDGFFIVFAVSNAGTQQSTYFGNAVLKLGGSIVKGSFTAGASDASSWNSGVQAIPQNVINFFASLQYTHTDGNTYEPSTPVNSSDNTTWPSTQNLGSFPTNYPQSSYDNRGVQLQ